MAHFKFTALPLLELKTILRFKFTAIPLLICNFAEMSLFCCHQNLIQIQIPLDMYVS